MFFKGTDKHIPETGRECVWPIGQVVCGTQAMIYIDGVYTVILRIVKAGCHPVAIAQVVEH